MSDSEDATIAVQKYLTKVEERRVEIMKRVGKPMWMRQGWKPSGCIYDRHRDPLDEARCLARQEPVGGVVMLPASLLKALVERKECSARCDFDRDEDGPTSWVTHAVCRVAEGHEGAHSNGYFSWPNTQASGST